VRPVDAQSGVGKRLAILWQRHLRSGIRKARYSAGFSVDFDILDLPSEIKKAVILHHGKLTPDYQYINKFL